MGKYKGWKKFAFGASKAFTAPMAIFGEDQWDKAARLHANEKARTLGAGGYNLLTGKRMEPFDNTEENLGRFGKDWDTFSNYGGQTAAAIMALYGGGMALGALGGGAGAGAAGGAGAGGAGAGAGMSDAAIIAAGGVPTGSGYGAAAGGAAAAGAGGGAAAGAGGGGGGALAQYLPIALQAAESVRQKNEAKNLKRDDYIPPSAQKSLDQLNQQANASRYYDQGVYDQELRRREANARYSMRQSSPDGFSQTQQTASLQGLTQSQVQQNAEMGRRMRNLSRSQYSQGLDQMAVYENFNKRQHDEAVAALTEASNRNLYGAVQSYAQMQMIDSMMNNQGYGYNNGYVSYNGQAQANLMNQLDPSLRAHLESSYGGQGGGGMPQGPGGGYSPMSGRSYNQPFFGQPGYQPNYGYQWGSAYNPTPNYGYTPNF